MPVQLGNRPPVAGTRFIRGALRRRTIGVRAPNLRCLPERSRKRVQKREAIRTSERREPLGTFQPRPRGSPHTRSNQPSRRSHCHPTTANNGQGVSLPGTTPTPTRSCPRTATERSTIIPTNHHISLIRTRAKGDFSRPGSIGDCGRFQAVGRAVALDEVAKGRSLGDAIRKGIEAAVSDFKTGPTYRAPFLPAEGTGARRISHTSEHRPG